MVNVWDSLYSQFDVSLLHLSDDNFSDNTWDKFNFFKNKRPLVKSELFFL